MLATVFRRFFVYSLTLILGFFVLPAPTRAAVSWRQATQISVGSGQRLMTLFDGHFPGGASVTAGDTDGDGVDEYVVGAGATGGPQVEVYKQTGRKVASWFAFDRRTTAGLFVAAGDLDGDGQAEIAVGPNDGFRPEIEVYHADGSLLGTVTAFEASYTGGVRVGIIPSHNGQSGQIIAASGAGRDQEVRLFSWPQLKVVTSWSPFGANVAGNGLNVAGAWSPTFGEPVAVVAADRGRSPIVFVYGLTSRRLLAAWQAYPSSVKTGLSVAVRDDLVFIGPGPGGGPEVRRFTIRGHDAISTYVFPSTYRGGVRLAATVLDGVATSLVVPMNVSLAAPDATVGSKHIEIVLSKQELRLHEGGKLVSVRRVSTGKWSTPTPTGTFRTYNKTLVAYSRAYGLYMEYWMAITPDGKFGLHALPFWRLRGGGRLYEGANHIGTPVSHGCIRQTVAEAKSLYAWAPIGTPVTITR